MSPTDIATVLTNLERLREQLDPDAAEADARRVANETAAKASALDNRIVVIRQSTLTIRACDAQIATEFQWREFLAVARAQLCKELLALPARIRDAKTLGVHDNVTLSISIIDGHRIKDMAGFTLNTLRVGQLMIEYGYREGPKQPGQTFGDVPWFGSTKEVEQRLARLRAARDAAQHRLDDALLGDDSRASQAIEIAARNALPQRKVRGDGSVYLKFRDGRTEEVEG